MNLNKVNFEYCQDGEFTEPYYVVRNSIGCDLGYLFFELGEWKFNWKWFAGNEQLDQVSAKIKELNTATYNQRILGVF